jgi:hypothetical protein
MTINDEEVIPKVCCRSANSSPQCTKKYADFPILSASLALLREIF